MINWKEINDLDFWGLCVRGEKELKRGFIDGRGFIHSHTHGDREETVAWLGGEESGG